MASANLIVIERALDQLISIYETVARKRAICEAVCNDCRQLLRPWSSRKQKSGVNEQKDGTKLSNTNNNMGNATGENALLLSKDMEVFSLVDRVLAKAEKTRKVLQAKLSETEPENTELKLSGSDAFLPEDVDNDMDRKSTITHSSVTNQTQSKQPKTQTLRSSKDTGQKKTVDDKKSVLEKPGIISQKSLNGIAKVVNEMPSGSKCSTAGRLPTTKKQTLSYKPAHQMAPFKTASQPTIRRPTATSARPGNRKLPSPSQSTALPRSSTVAGAPRMSRPASTSTVLSATSELVVNQTVYTSQVSEPAEADISQSASSSNSAASVDNSTSRTWAAGRSSATQPVGADNEIAAEPPQFLLQRDGKQLKIPTALRKAATTNNSLREKLHKSMTSSKPRKLCECESSAENFISRLNDHMAERCPPLTFQLLDEIKICCDIYDLLLRLLNNTPDVSTLEALPWQRAVQARTTLAFVLNEFADLEETFASLCSKLPAPPTERPPRVYVPTPRDNSSFLSKWLPCRFNKDFPRIAPFVRYRSSRQLVKYNSLLHDIQLRLLQQQVLREIGQCVINLLQCADPSDPAFSRLYRVTFALVTSFGQHFPTTVKDSVNDAC